MAGKWGKSGPIEMVGRKTAFFRDTTVCQQKMGGTVRKRTHVLCTSALKVEVVHSLKILISNYSTIQS
jgi:hypothetical protein